MSIHFYILTIFLLLAILAALLLYAMQYTQWPIINQFSIKLKTPQKRALLIVHESKKCLRHMHKQLKKSRQSPAMAEDVLGKMQELLPIEGILIKERARLYNLVQHIRISFVRASQKHRYHSNSLLKKRQSTVSMLTLRFNTLIHVHSRLDELDNEAKERKDQTNTLLHLAEKYTTAQHYTKLAHCLKVAEKMQQQNIKLLKAIHNTEKNLIVISKKLGRTVKKTAIQRYETSSTPR